MLGAQPAKEAQQKPIEQLIERFADAWNGHDAAGVAANFAEDAEVTNWRGDYTQGRAAIERGLKSAFASPAFKESNYLLDLRRVRFVQPDVASVEIEWTMTGARNPDGSSRGTRQGLIVWTAVRREGQWRVAVMHTVDFTSYSREADDGAGKDLGDPEEKGPPEKPVPDNDSN